jgi:hypothetical protein
MFKASPGRVKWTGGVTQVLEQLLCKGEALISNPSPLKKKKGSSYLVYRIDIFLCRRQGRWIHQPSFAQRC